MEFTFSNWIVFYYYYYYYYYLFFFIFFLLLILKEKLHFSFSTQILETVYLPVNTILGMSKVTSSLSNNISKIFYWQENYNDLIEFKVHLISLFLLHSIDCIYDGVLWIFQILGRLALK